MSSTYAIGDIHGELEKLKRLFRKIDPKKDDTIIFLGDYIDRGPDSKGVIDFIVALKDVCNVIALKGNHETFATESFKMLRHEPYMAQYVNSWMMNGGNSCLRSYANRGTLETALKVMLDSHGEFLENLQLTHEDENRIFVHGYLNHTLDVADQVEFFCLWGRFLDIQPHKSGKTVVCGHSVQQAPVNMGYKICIDTGSFKPDGFITAMHIQGNKERFIDSR